MLLCCVLTSCSAGKENQADFSALEMPEGYPFYFGTAKTSEFAPAGGHDPCVIKDPNTGIFYAYSTDTNMGGTGMKMGIQIRKSSDLIHWEYVGVALSKEAIAQARDNGEDAQPATSFWAPDIEYVDGEYRLYYSVTKAFGSAESCIWLAVSDNPEGPFENRGIAVSSWGNYSGLGPNAIDPDLLNTPEGKKYLAYGSYFGGIYLKELGTDGLGLNDTPKTPEYRGVQIAHKGSSLIDGPEGSSLIYCPETGYYYLFLSYGWLGETYDIRVGRSKTPEGPYLDYLGNDMKEKTDGTTGTKLACSYQFQATQPGGEQPYIDSEWEWGGFQAPGHGAVFEEAGEYYFVHHIRDGAEQYHFVSETESSYTMHYLMTRKIAFVDGWPVLSPEPYAGETEEEIAADYLQGNWELIAFTDENNQQKTSEYAKFGGYRQDQTGTVNYDNQKGVWTYSEGNQLKIILDDGREIHAAVMKCWDFENQKATICFSGLDQQGIAYWGKYC